MKKYRVGVLFGGMSCEHEISCLSVKTFFANLRKDIYAIQAFHIGLDGRFSICNEQYEPLIDKNLAIISPAVFQALSECDLFIPVLHGPFGEDGLVQGFLEVLRKPYVGCDVRSGSVSMDKALAKAISLANHIATAPYVTFDRGSWNERQDMLHQEIIQILSFPLFVKPTHLGSAVGISKVIKEEDLDAAIGRAFQYDTHVLVESGLDVREIEFAVLGNQRIQVPPPAEVLTNGTFYDYESKYGANGCKAAPKADLTDEIMEEGRALAEKIYRAVGCQGLARVDFFLDKSNKYWFNEINPLPGFTPISGYPKVWELQGPLSELMDRLIILALQRFREQERIFSFSCKNLSRL